MEEIKKINTIFTNLLFDQYNGQSAVDDFDVELGFLLDELLDTKDDEKIIPAFNRTKVLLSGAMDPHSLFHQGGKGSEKPQEEMNDDELTAFQEKIRYDDLLDEILHKHWITVTDYLDKWEKEDKETQLDKKKQEQVLHVENWDPSKEELDNFIECNGGWVGGKNSNNKSKTKLSEKTLKKVMKFLEGQIFDEEFNILLPHTNGGCRIEENETSKQIFKRIESNLKNIRQPPSNAGQEHKRDFILIVLVLCIIGILQGKKRISKNVLKNAGFSRQNLLMKYYNGYNKTKKHGYLFMLQSCIRYLTSPPSSKQRTLLRKRLGVDSHWSKKLTWDYFTAYQKMEGVQKPNWFNEFGQALWYSDPERLNDEMNNVVEELTYCIKKGYIKFNFVSFVTLKDSIRRILEERLNAEYQKTGKKSQTKENSALGIFLVEKYDAYYKHLIEYHNSPFKKDELRFALREILKKDDDPYQEIAHLLEWRNNEYFMIKNEDVKLEYKANFFYPPERLGEKWEEEKKNQRKKAEREIQEKLKGEQKEKQIEKQKDFVKRTEKEYEIERWQEICAFLNTDGGKLIIGVDDDIKKPIFGIEKDHDQAIFAEMSKEKFQDKYPLHITDKIYSEFKDHKAYIDVDLIPLPKKEEKFILVITVRTTPGRNAQITLISGRKIYVIREGSASRRIHDTNEYLRWRDEKMKSSD